MKVACVDIFDGLVNATLRNQIITYIMGSAFRIGWPDSSIGPKSAYKYLHSRYTKEELIACGLGNVILSSPEIAPLVEGKELTRCVINLTHTGDINFAHTHPTGETVVLYYANLDWLPEWRGETMFYNDDCSEIIYASRYTPGRIVVFDATIPHAINPQSSIGPQNRFTVTISFNPIPPKVEA